jgi:hypothetical protein
MDGDVKLPDNVVMVSQNKDEVERVARLRSEFNYDPAKTTYPVYDDNRMVVGCLTQSNERRSYQRA